MLTLIEPINQFDWTGQLLDFVIKDGDKIKYLHLKVQEQEHWLQLPKKLRKNLDRRIVPGCTLAVKGSRKLKKTGEIKLKAEVVKLIENQDLSPLQEVDLAIVTEPKEKILICQKSDCWKKSGCQLFQALEKGLKERGLTERVSIKLTGCLKQCKKGPNLIMPDRRHYSQIKPQQISQLLDRYFPNPIQTQTQ